MLERITLITGNVGKAAEYAAMLTLSSVTVPWAEAGAGHDPVLATT